MAIQFSASIEHLRDAHAAASAAYRDFVKGLPLHAGISAEQAEEATRLGDAARASRDKLWKAEDADRDQRMQRIPSLRSLIGVFPAGEITIGEDAHGRRVVTESGDDCLSEQTWGDIAEAGYDAAFRRYLRIGDTQNEALLRTLEVGLDPQGGFLAPAENQATLIQRSPTPRSLRDLVTTVTTTRDAISIPRVNYTGNAADDPNGTIYSTGMRATLVDENPTSDTQANVSDLNMFGAVRIPVFLWMYRIVVSYNLREDAGFDLLGWLESVTDQTTRVIEDYYALLGNGTGQPLGILTNPGGTDTLTSVPTVSSGSAGAPYLTIGGVINLAESIPGQYDRETRYLFDKTTTGAVVRGLNDAGGRPIFRRKLGGDGRTMPSVNGFPALFNGWMPSPGASGINQYPMAAGDFGGITLVRRLGTSFQVLRETLARRNQYEIIVRTRFGMQATRPWQMRVMAVGA